MKETWIKLSQQYGTALKKSFELGPGLGRRLARGVGRQAAAMGFSALDLARMHDHSLAKLGVPISKDGTLHRTDAFFSEACMPLELTRLSASAAAAQVKHLERTLRQRTIELLSSQARRKRESLERTALKGALKERARRYNGLLAESRDLQQDLQNLTRRILSAHEGERAIISRKLHENVAQAVLGIQVRLADIRNETARNTVSLKKEIASTQRLVGKSAKALERFGGSGRQGQ